MPKQTRLLIQISDLHCGSTVGLMPPGFVRVETQNEIKQNKLQVWLWAKWQAFIKTVLEQAGGDPFHLIINGDCTDGVHHGTKEIISPDVADHLACAIHCLSPLANHADKVFVVEGTECHTHGLEGEVGRQIGGENNPETGRPVFDKLRLKMCGVLGHWHHHMSCTKRKWLEASALCLELRNEQLNYIESNIRNGDEIPRILGLAHRHVGGKYDDGTFMAVCSPPWQMRTRYAKKVVPSSLTQPGGVIFDWRKRADGELPDARMIKYEPHTTTKQILKG